MALDIAKTEMIKLTYYKNIFGHLHRNPSQFSSSLTTLACNHPVKIFKMIDKNGKEQISVDDKWYYASVGSHMGFIQMEYLSDKKVNCFQEQYPRFFDAFNLDLTELYYFGRLYDQYFQETSTVK